MTPKPKAGTHNQASSKVDPYQWITPWGPMIYDLIYSLVPREALARKVYTQTLERLRGTARSHAYEKYRREWVLAVLWTTLQDLLEGLHRPGDQQASESTFGLDMLPDHSQKAARFLSFFQRLNAEDRFILLLHDKYEVPLHEVAAVLNTPEASLAFRRKQALAALESWLWDT